ncbi:hypothetical protein F5Y13DRAFT_34486 [Hypoxylon sp. FL1857]|nr:hypothetical protein F5Y13DRAFT_34486 [Hypoxylon sp. FL1857]
MSSHQNLALTHAQQTGTVKTCDVCKNSIPTVEAHIGGWKQDGTHRYLCDGCNVIPKADQMLPIAPYWSAILNKWRPSVDSRPWYFIRLPQHSIPFLVRLHQLSKYYTFEDVSIMLNSISMERIRHGLDKRRFTIQEDWSYLHEACKQTDFDPTHPHEVTARELRDMNLKLNSMGLIEPGAAHPDDHVKGVCARGRACANTLPYGDRVVFTWAYRHRGGCDIIA